MRTINHHRARGASSLLATVAVYTITQDVWLTSAVVVGSTASAVGGIFAMAVDDYFKRVDNANF